MPNKNITISDFATLFHTFPRQHKRKLRKLQIKCETRDLATFLQTNMKNSTDFMYEIGNDCVRYIGVIPIRKLLEKHNLSYIFKGGCTYKIISNDPK